MKFQTGFQYVIIVLLVLTLTQLACNFGAQPSGSNPQPVSTSAPQATQIPATEAPQATQAPPAATSERGTPDEAKAMLQKAIDHYNQAGRDQALADFNSRIAPFFDRDLYVVCMGSDHIETANGGFPQYVGVSADALTDNAGHPLGKVIWDAASDSAVNSVDYHWVNPVNGQTEPKTLFFQKVGTDVCGVGAYNP
jgi:cytochrome c